MLGILLLAAPLAAAIGGRGSGAAGRWRRALAEGAAMTAAATLATAPLIAFHFGEVSTVTLVANLLALPAVAPAMWLGMLAAAAGQVPGFPVEPLNAARLPAARLHRPGRLLVRAAGLGLARRCSLGPGGLVGSYAAIVAGARSLVPSAACAVAGSARPRAGAPVGGRPLAVAAARRARGARPGCGGRRGRRRRRRRRRRACG